MIEITFTINDDGKGLACDLRLSRQAATELEIFIAKQIANAANRLAQDGCKIQESTSPEQSLPA